MEDSALQNEKTSQKKGAVPDPAILSWALFWRYIFSQASVVFLFAAIVCFFAYNWAAMSVFTKFLLIAGGMVLTTLLPLSKGLEGLAGSTGLLFCGLLAGPLLAVYGQHYQTGADAWELFRTWAFFLLPLTLLGRRTGLWFSLWIVASLAFFLFLMQQNTLHSHRDDIWISLPFLCSQILFLIFWESAAVFRPSGSLPFLASRWLPRFAAGLILFYMTSIISKLIFYWPRMEDFSGFPFLSPYTILYFSFLCIAAFYYTKRVFDLSILAMGLTSIVAVGLMVFLNFFERWWNDGFALLVLALYLLLASAAGVKILLLCHKREKKRQKEKRTLEDAYFAPRNAAEKKAFFPLDLLNSNNLVFALKGPDRPMTSASRFLKKEERPEEKAPWMVPFLMGLGAWVTLPFLLGGIVLVLQASVGKEGMILLFLAIMGIGSFFSRVKGSFANQAGLCLALSGTIGACAFIFLRYESFFSAYVLVPAIFLFILGFFLVPNRIYRLIAASSTFSLFFIQLLIKLEDATALSNRKVLWMGTMDNMGSIQKEFFWLLLVVVFAIFLVALAHFWFQAKHGENNDSLQQPLLSGAFFSLILFSCALYLDASFARSFNDILPIASSAFGIGAGLGLFWFFFRFSKKFHLNLPIMLGLLGLSLFLAVTGLRIYWIPVGLFLLCLARGAASFSLMGLGVAYLSCMTVLEYYNQSTSLLHKSFSLAILGFSLGLVAFGVHFILKSMLENQQRKVAETAEGSVSAGSNFGAGKLDRGAVFLCLCAFLALFTGSVREKEALLSSGTQIILALRPLDPRSLMQGDYMILTLEVEEQIRSALRDLGPSNPAQLQGLAFVRPDEKGVARFSRLDDGSTPEPEEIRLVYRRKTRGIRISSGAFFFQEGHGKAYNAARFAALRVDTGGEALLTDLLDEKLRKIAPE